MRSPIENQSDDIPSRRCSCAGWRRACCAAVDDVRHAELRVAVDDSLVLVRPAAAHIDLVVRLIPGHINLDRAGAHGVVEVEGLDRVDKRAALAKVDAPARTPRAT